MYIADLLTFKAWPAPAVTLDEAHLKHMNFLEGTSQPSLV